MDCPRASELLVEYLYQELDSTLVVPFEAHVASCPRCAEQLQAFKATRAAVQSLPELEPPAEVTQGLIATAAQALSPKTTFWDYLRRSLRFAVMHPAMTAAVTLLVVVGISFYAYRQSSPPSRVPRPAALPPEPPSTFETPMEADRLSARGESTLQLKEEEDSTASIAARKGARPAPAKIARVRKVEFKLPTVPVAQPAAEPAKQVGTAAQSSSKTGDNDRLQLARTPPTRRRRRPPPKPRPRPVRPKATAQKAQDDRLQASETEKGNVAQYLALGHAAAAKQLCFQALEYYNRVLVLRPQLKKSLNHKIQQCVGVLARDGEAQLLRAQKRFPTLSRVVGRELTRLREAPRKRTKAKAKPRKAKKKAPTSVGY
jgi:hypothetical protein